MLLSKAMHKRASARYTAPIKVQTPQLCLPLNVHYTWMFFTIMRYPLHMCNIYIYIYWVHLYLYPSQLKFLSRAVIRHGMSLHMHEHYICAVPAAYCTYNKIVLNLIIIFDNYFYHYNLYYIVIYFCFVVVKSKCPWCGINKVLSYSKRPRGNETMHIKYCNDQEKCPISQKGTDHLS